MLTSLIISIIKVIASYHKNSEDKTQSGENYIMLTDMQEEEHKIEIPKRSSNLSLFVYIVDILQALLAIFFLMWLIAGSIQVYSTKRSDCDTFVFDLGFYFLIICWSLIVLGVVLFIIYFIYLSFKAKRMVEKRIVLEKN